MCIALIKRPFRPHGCKIRQDEGKQREETCMPESSTYYSQSYVESTNPDWASVVDYGLNPFSLWEETLAL
ncbi:jg11702 [Pararge aegeria aegeria]|uniref:Jg11702 protein n=1 Tax=Pararge aegeria aegeria TaxID=348720 RepID=A0A8S4S5B7_9NEOP|nr:jg11702 [Pararge aegeria aegeria]